jgi:hypothetical protein
LVTEIRTTFFSMTTRYASSPNYPISTARADQRSFLRSTQALLKSDSLVALSKNRLISADIFSAILVRMAGLVLSRLVIKVLIFRGLIGSVSYLDEFCKRTWFFPFRGCSWFYRCETRQCR